MANEGSATGTTTAATSAAGSTTAPTAPATQTTPAAPAAFAPPPGMRVVPESEYNRLSSRVSSADNFYRAAKAAGYERAEDFTRAQTSTRETETVEITPDAVAEKAASRVLSALDARDSQRQVQSEYQAATATEASMVERAVETISKSAPDALKDIAAELVKSAVRSAGEQSFYPEGHPLAAKAFKPLDKAAIDGIVAGVKAKLDKFGGDLSTRLADSAIKGMPGSTRPGTGLGAPDPAKAPALRAAGRGREQTANQTTQKLADWASNNPRLQVG